MAEEKLNGNAVENGHKSSIRKGRQLMSGDTQEAHGSNAGTTQTNNVILPASVLDELYQNYSIKQRQGGIKWFLCAAIIFNVWCMFVPQTQGMEPRAVSVVAFCCNVLLVAFVHLNQLLVKSASTPNAATALQRLWKCLYAFIPHALWTICMAHLVLYIYLQHSTSPRDVLGWAILINFLVYVTLPVPLLYTGCVIGFLTLIGYMVTIQLSSRADPLLCEMLIANFILIASSATIGLLYYFINEAKQRRTFLEAKKSLEVKMLIEEQSAEQERLLLSVLPKHVAVKMRQDLGATSSEPFKKIYMSRHENVSILYADIVGFTAISSTYSAQDLVKMLNELFARFDRLAEKYQQLRIKILGDCYYCISGAPIERPDHAVLCVHMGLSMVKAIKYVQQKTKSPVDMRVGIHTGAVLAGILGQRQWQFDVYSKDVELANKMESSGKAGRVHISDKTLAFLNGEFEVEPAYGERREESLRIAGLKTYFICKVLKPFPSPGVRMINETPNVDNDNEALDEELLAESNSNSQANHETETTDEEDNKQAVFKQRLQEELVARNGHENLSKDITLFLKFKSKNLETAYAAYREPYSSVPLTAALFVQFIDVLYSFIILPRMPLHFVNIAAPLVPVFMLVLISVAESFPTRLPQLITSISKRFNDITFVRELTAIVIALTIGLSNVLDMYFFASSTVRLETNDTESFLFLPPLGDDAETEIAPAQQDVILYPSYLSNFGVLILIAIAIISQLTHITKIVLMLLITAVHCVANLLICRDLYAYEDRLALNTHHSTSLYMSGLLLVAALALSCFARHMDYEDRVIFKWKTEVAEQKEMATDMRQRNEALVYNVLPQHVAEHFMKNTKRSHDDLYSQSYSEVGVLFASMPNFSDFYSEETVNNQGLECLRFLNEVISDFDALLELPQFQDIIKIKTIGSTYMAASGINVHHHINTDDPVTKRWAHLAVLVEFALELKTALQSINEQSFNHFVLKMGINHGPITAGVIGARKPHYDIWGNTVNVASRMESTGKAGAIQVTEETCNILKEFGYTFLQRGLVSVKGKGQLMTYYLQGKSYEPQQHHAAAAAEEKFTTVVNLEDTLCEIEPATTITTTPAVTTATTLTDAIKKYDEPDADSKTPLLNADAHIATTLTAELAESKAQD